MWRCRFLMVLVAALALNACVHQTPQPEVVASDLDALMYGAPTPGYAMRGRDKAAAPVVAETPVTAAPAVAPPPIVAAMTPATAYAIEMPDAQPYTLDAGDKLRVVVFGQDTLSNTYTVDAQGIVTMPLIGGVMARGRTTQQLASAITSRLKSSVLRDPSVAVEVDTYRPFFALGEVTYPGQYPYVPNLTVETAVAIAGGFTPRAFKPTVTVTRKFQGIPTRYELPMQAPILPGDTITVGERWF